MRDHTAYRCCVITQHLGVAWLCSMLMLRNLTAHQCAIIAQHTGITQSSSKFRLRIYAAYWWLCVSRLDIVIVARLSADGSRVRMLNGRSHKGICNTVRNVSIGCKNACRKSPVSNVNTILDRERLETLELRQNLIKAFAIYTLKNATSCSETAEGALVVCTLQTAIGWWSSDLQCYRNPIRRSPRILRTIEILRTDPQPLRRQRHLSQVSALSLLHLDTATHESHNTRFHNNGLSVWNFEALASWRRIHMNMK